MTPSWLDANFIQEALRRGGESDAIVTSIIVQPVGATGDNYGSYMHRVTAETNTGAQSLIVKSALPFMETAPSTFNAFIHETYMLTKVLPELHKILNDVAPGRFPPFSPKCFHSGSSPTDFIVMEDLATNDFGLANRHRGLGLRHSLHALRTLARFHAASAVLLCQYPLVKEILKNPLPQLECFLRPYITSCFKTLPSLYRNIPSSDQESLDAIDELESIAVDKYMKVNDYKPNRFNVINHGDAWCNNMMFRYEDGDVREIRFVDFQLSRVSSPTIDLHYFLTTSVSEEVSMHHTDMLIREYHVALTETMEILELKAPSLEDLLEDMQTTGFHAVVNAMVALPIIKPESKVVFDVEKAITGETEPNSMLMSPVIQRWLLRLLPEHYRKGWLK